MVVNVCVERRREKGREKERGEERRKQSRVPEPFYPDRSWRGDVALKTKRERGKVERGEKRPIGPWCGSPVWPSPS